MKVPDIVDVMNVMKLQWIGNVMTPRICGVITKETAMKTISD
jgi:hypothetical protein